MKDSPAARLPLHRPLRGRVRAASTAVAVLALACVGQSASAATSFTAVSVWTSVSGSTVTAKATVKASTSTKVTQYGVCVRSASGAVLDFPKASATLTTAGTSTPVRTKTFAPGTYTYNSCFLVGSVWKSAGAKKTFSVAAERVASTSMPVGNLPGWKQVYKQDFSANAALGQVGNVYGQTMRGYDQAYDTSKHGWYAPDKVLSVSGGALHWKLHVENGVPLVAAPVPMGWNGQTYGRFSIRYRTNTTPGYTHSFMLFPQSNNWNDGEIDYPNGNFGTKPYGSSAKKGSVSNGKISWDPSVPFYAPNLATSWHVATIEWSPGLVRFLWDGSELGRTKVASAVPNTPMRWVLQAETSDWNIWPAASATGTIDVDWMTAYSYAP